LSAPKMIPFFPFNKLFDIILGFYKFTGFVGIML